MGAWGNFIMNSNATSSENRPIVVECTWMCGFWRFVYKGVIFSGLPRRRQNTELSFPHSLYVLCTYVIWLFELLTESNYYRVSITSRIKKNWATFYEWRTPIITQSDIWNLERPKYYLKESRMPHKRLDTLLQVSGIDAKIWWSG